MKAFLALLITLYVSLFTFEVFAQWQPDVRLTNNPSASTTCINNAWSVASSGDSVHVVWQDQRDGNIEIYYKRSTNAGASWGADIRLTNNAPTSIYPSISVSGQVVHVAWQEQFSGNYQIHYKRSTDGGTSWSADARLTNNTPESWNPSISVSGSLVNIVYYKLNGKIYSRSSTDAGISWSIETLLTNNALSAVDPSVSVSGLDVHVVWEDRRDGNQEIYYKRSTDGGSSWGADTRLTNNALISTRASLSVSGLAVHVVWYDERDGNPEIYYKRSTDGGTSWGADTRLTNNSAFSQFSNVSVSGQAVHVVWEELRDGNKEIYYKRSTDGGTSWGADLRVTSNIDFSYSPSVSISGSVVHVVWQDYRDGNWEIYYKRDPTGNPVGIHTISNEIPNGFLLKQNYPNPFNPVTNINFSIPKTGIVKLVLYNALGKEVARLVNGQYNAGSYEVDFDASALASGVYFYRIDTEGFSDTRKMMLIK